MITAPRPSPLPVRKIVDAFDFSVEYVATRDDGSVVLLTNAGAPRYRLVHGTWGAAATTPLSSWPDLVPQHPRHLLQWARAAAGDALLVGWLADVVSVVELRSLATGALVRTASPGGIGTAAGVSVQRNDASLHTADGAGTSRTRACASHHHMCCLFLLLQSQKS